MIQHGQTQPANPHRVVVLGATGFVGRDLVEYLGERGVETVGLSSAQLDLEEAEAADRLAAILEKDDALVFASALTPDRGKDAATLLRNLRMAENVAAALKRQPCQQVVYLSSDAVYSEGNPLRETSPCDAPGLYGPMHRLRENILAAVVDPKKLLVLRPCALYGPGDTHNSYGPNRFIRTALAEGRIGLIGQGEERRDHVFVRDLTRLMDECMRRRSGGILNVATGNSVSFAELAEVIARLVGRPIWLEHSPRTNRVIHRFFDGAALRRAFPFFRFGEWEAGLTATLAAKRASAAALAEVSAQGVPA